MAASAGLEYDGVVEEEVDGETLDVAADEIGVASLLSCCISVAPKSGLVALLLASAATVFSTVSTSTGSISRRRLLGAFLFDDEDTDKVSLLPVRGVEGAGGVVAE